MTRRAAPLAFPESREPRVGADWVALRATEDLALSLSSGKDSNSGPRLARYPSQVSTQPVRVAILGSCISRDVFNTQFNSGYKDMWHCDLMQNQSSLISIMSPELPIPEDQFGDHMSDYQKGQVRSDTSKAFLEQLRQLRPDYLILDFFGDVHFGVLEAAPGQYVTNNRWMLHQTQWYAARKAAGDLRPCA